MKYLTKQLLVYIFLLYPLFTFAIKPYPYVRYITTSDGLSSPNIRAMVEDDLGNMWFAGRGINFFDGQKVYDGNIIKGSNNKYKDHSRIRKSKGGKLWAVNVNSGELDVYDSYTKSVTYYGSLPDKEGNEIDFSSYKVLDVYINPSKTEAWMSTRKHGVLKLLIDKEGNPYRIEEIDSNIDLGKDERYGYLLVDNNDNVWLGYGKRLFCKKVNQHSFQRIDDSHLSNIEHLYKGKDNEILICTVTGLWTVNSSQSVQPVLSDKSHILNNTNVSRIHQDDNKAFWMMTNQGLAMINDLSGKEQLHIVCPELAGKQLLDIQSDSYGGIWFSARLVGIGYINAFSPSFGYLEARRGEGKNVIVYDLCRDDKGVVWMVTNKGVTIYDSEQDKFYYYKRKDSKQDPPLWGLRPFKIIHTTTGDIWLCTGVGHLLKVEGDSYSNLSFKWYKRFPDFGNVTSFTEGQDGSLWVSSNNKGLVKFSPSTEKWEKIEVGGKVNTDIYKVLADNKDDYIWLGTNQGIQRISVGDGGNLEVKDYKPKPRVEGSYNFQHVYYLQQDDSGDLWLSPKYGSTYKMVDKEKGVFKEVLKQEDVVERFNEQYLVDRGGRYIWMAGKGLTLYDTETGKITVFDKQLTRSNVYSDRGAYQDKEGYIYFPGAYGVNFTRTDYLKESDYKPTVYLSDFKILGESIHLGDTINDRVLLDKPVQMMEEIELFHDETDFSLFVKGIYPPSNYKLTYYYMLEGLYQKWSSTKEGIINIGGLSSGNYTLKVYAEDELGHRSEEKELEILIIPPVWERLWFRALAILLILLLFYGFYRYKLKALKRNKAKLEGIVKERTAEIETQNKELVEQSAEISTQRDQILKQHMELQTSYKDIYRLNDFGKEFSTIRDINTLVSTSLQSLQAFMNVDTFMVTVAKNDNKYFNLYRIKNGEETHSRLQKNKFESYLFYQSFKEQKRIVLNDSNDLESDYFVDGNIKSAVHIPLLYQSKSLGTLSVASQEVEAYSERQLVILETLGAYFASTLENVNSYDIILSKNENIIASIEYAKTIQRALLSSVDKIISYFPEHFVLYQPKDIVSGDFYWAYERDNKLFIVVADCTGHGVPGALLSVIGINILNKIVGELKITEPNQILENINIEMKELLAQETSRNDDGMDMSICVFEKLEQGTIQLHFAGAKSDLRIFRQGTNQCELVKGTRRSIGGWSTNAKRSFEIESVELTQGDMIYLNSDGFIDQSNIEKRKFGTRRFNDTLASLSDGVCLEQKNQLQSELNTYMKGENQRDDITVLGIRV